MNTATDDELTTLLGFLEPAKPFLNLAGRLLVRRFFPSHQVQEEQRLWEYWFAECLRDGAEPDGAATRADDALVLWRKRFGEQTVAPVVDIGAGGPFAHPPPAKH